MAGDAESVGGGLDDLADGGPACGTLFVTDVDDHRAAFEEEGSAALEGRAADGEEGLFDRDVAFEEEAFDLIFDEVEVELLEGGSEVGGHGFAADKELVVGDGFADFGVVVAHGGGDVSGGEGGADSHVGFLESFAVGLRGLGYEAVAAEKKEEGQAAEANGMHGDVSGE
jgi:hypothetical protein